LEDFRNKKVKKFLNRYGKITKKAEQLRTVLVFILAFDASCANICKSEEEKTTGSEQNQ